MALPPRRRAAKFDEAIRRVCEGSLWRIPPEHHPAVLALVELLIGPFAYAVMHDPYAMPPERITRATLAALQATLTAFERHPEWLDPSAPVPPLFHPPGSG